MAFKSAGMSKKCLIRTSELGERKLSETGQDLEDSGVHLDDSPTFFTCDSKAVAYQYPHSRPIAAASVWMDKPDLVTCGKNGQSSKTCITMTTVTSTNIGCHGDCRIGNQEEPTSMSLAPLRLKQSSSSTEAVTFFTGSDVNLHRGKVEPVVVEHVEDVFLSAPETPVVRNSKDKTGGMTKFQKFFEPLRRSRSAGNTKESKEEPPFGFFFRNNSRKEERLSADTGNGSLESELDRDSEDRSQSDRSKSKSLTSEVKERFSFLLRHNPDSSQPYKEGKREKLTHEAVLNWAKSFDYLLADKNGLHWFREFLKSEFSEENIEFWIACEEYKHLKPHKLADQAQKIFMQFVTHQAPREINIDSRTRDITYENMKHPETTTFEAAQKRIESLMGKDSYPRFIESDLYLHLLAGLKS